MILLIVYPLTLNLARVVVLYIYIFTLLPCRPYSRAFLRQFWSNGFTKLTLWTTRAGHKSESREVCRFLRKVFGVAGVAGVAGVVSCYITHEEF